MTDFWPRLFIAALVIVGIWTAFDKQMIFGKLGDFLNALLPKWAVKPLFDCPPCMASVHGTWLWFALGGDFAMWPVFVLALAGLLKIVSVEWLSR